MRPLAALLVVAIAACRPSPTAPPTIANRPGRHAPAPTTARGAITKAGVEALLARRFADELAAGTYVAEWNGTEDDVLAELAAMGWDDLAQLARAIPIDYERRAAHQFKRDNPANIPGTVRDFMILADARRYFADAWQNHWATLAPGDLEVYRAYQIDLTPLRAASVIPDGGAP